MHKILLLFSLLQILSFSTSTAYSENIIELDNLSFDCETCSISKEYGCNILLANNSKTLKCSDALAYFYQKASLNYTDRNKLSIFPTSLQLKNFIINPDKPNSDKLIALNLLLITQGSLKILREFLQTIIKDNASLLLENIPFDKAHQELWLTLWNTPSSADNENDAILRASVFANYQQITLENLFDEFLSDYLIKQTSTSSLEAIISKKRKTDAEIIEIIGNLTSNCKKSLKLCHIPEELKLGSRLTESIENIFLRINLLKYETRNISESEALEYIRSINYRKFNSSLLQDFIILILSSADNTCDLSNDYFELISFFATKNSTINQIYKTNCSQLNVSLSIILTALLALTVILILAVLYKRKIKSMNEMPSFLDYQQEAAELLKYFNLETETDTLKLHERYKELVKKLHPDTTRARTEGEFIKLTENYKRLMQILEITSRLKH